MQHLVHKQHPRPAVAEPAAAADISWKIAAMLIGLALVAYVIVLLRVMTFTLLTMNGDIADMRGQLHETTAALRQTNQELLHTNRKLVQTNGKLRSTGAGVFAMKGDTDRMIRELGGMQRGLSVMLGDIHQMTHRIVHAKLLF